MKHVGIVTRVTDDHTATVEVSREHACTGCSEKNACSMQSANSVKVTFRNAGDLRLGDKVEISIKSGDFFRSMFAVYIVPLIFMLIVAVTVDSVQKNQMITAASTLAVPAIYFILLRFMHNGKDRQTYRKL